MRGEHRAPAPLRALARLAARRPHWLGPRDLTRIAAFLLPAAAVLAFAGLAGEVLEGETAGFDRAVLLALRNPADPADPIGPRWLEEVARDITGLGSHVILGGLTLGVAGYLALVRKRAAAMLVLGSIGGGMAISALVKTVIGRPRPDLVPHAVEVYTASFPSGHAMLSAVTYLTLGAIIAQVEAGWRTRSYVLFLAVAITLLVGASRVYLGVHWPTDVLAGWCLGAAWALLCWLLALTLQQRGKVETPEVSGDETGRG
ncbi:phosphatase PAP2 family protein [Roseomonas sp. GCM10028921]